MKHCKARDKIVSKPKMDLNRYHQNVYFPEEFPTMALEFVQLFTEEVDLTTHAAEQMYDKKDPRGPIPLPTNSQLFDHSNKLVEFYERRDHLGRIQKAVIRVGNLNEKYDYTYVVARDGVIITCWANDSGDNHRLTHSLNEYIQPPTNKL